MYNRIVKVFEEFKKMRILAGEDFLCEQGEKAHQIFCVIQGKFIKFKNNKEQQSFIIDFASENDIIGLNAIENGVFQSNVKALSNAKVAVLPLTRLSKLLEDDFELKFWTITQLCKEVDLLQKEAVELFDKNSKQKLAYILLKMANSFQFKPINTPYINLPHREIAELLGVTQKKFFELMNYFKSKGALDFQDNYLKTLDKNLIKTTMFG